MGTWEVRAFTAAAVFTAAIPVITHVVDTRFVHSPLSGLHVRVELPGDWVTDWRLEASDRHAGSPPGCILPSGIEQ